MNIKKKIAIVLSVLAIACGTFVYAGGIDALKTNTLAEYQVENNQLVLEKIDHPYKDDDYQQIWETVLSILPEDQTAYIDKYAIETDGHDNNLAYVTSDDNVHYTLSIDDIDLVDVDGHITQDGLWTLVHESGHILSLNSSQMSDDPETQSSFEIDEGTLSTSSYMYAFYSQYWERIIDRVNADDDYYYTHENDFVTEYAATNPIEDFAESYASFVLEDRPSGISIRDNKVNFFYDYPELVKYRDEIRANIESLENI